MTDLLIELGCEELPAASMMPLADHLAKALAEALEQSGLCSNAPEVFATPRRIAARFAEVGERQTDTNVERRGPAKAAAFKDGEPSKALQGFMRSAGVTQEQLSTIETPKGEWMVAKLTQPGKSLSEILADVLPAAIKTMPMPKRMRWGGGLNEFLRPVVWLTALHGSTVLPLELLGLNASKMTRGHRFHAPEPVALASPADYESALLNAHVLANPVKRRALIVESVERIAASLGGAAVMDEELIDEVNALVEWPVALAGKFDEVFLEIPKEALIQTMQENQRYFALLDNKGDIMPAFITIANLDSVDTSTVIDGNERVIRPRFADTMFFWEQDKKRKLADHQTDLSRLLFQEKLGTVADKVDRMASLGEWLAAQMGADAAEVKLAASLCKCDLNTEIVKELAKMQGICGRYYALRDEYSDDVAEAMEQHYFPKQAGGQLPQSPVSQAVALADKTDTLAGIFGLGMKPTGAKDPFALRRASLGIVRIIIEQGLIIDVGELLDQSLATYGERLESPDKAGMLAYVVERMRGYLLDKGYAADAIDAVLAKQVARPLDIVARLDAMQQFRSTTAAVSLSAASKRMANILKKTDIDALPVIDPALFCESAESALQTRLAAVQPLIEKHLQQGDYQAAMKETAGLREPVDDFFDQVRVMDDNPSIRDNRLALLRQVNDLCCATAELGLLTPAEKSG